MRSLIQQAPGWQIEISMRCSLVPHLPFTANGQVPVAFFSTTWVSSVSLGAELCFKSWWRANKLKSWVCTLLLCFWPLYLSTTCLCYRVKTTSAQVPELPLCQLWQDILEAASEACTREQCEFCLCCDILFFAVPQHKECINTKTGFSTAESKNSKVPERWYCLNANRDSHPGIKGWQIQLCPHFVIGKPRHGKCGWLAQGHTSQ